MATFIKNASQTAFLLRNYHEYQHFTFMENRWIVLAIFGRVFAESGSNGIIASEFSKSLKFEGFCKMTLVFSRKCLMFFKIVIPFNFFVECATNGNKAEDFSKCSKFYFIPGKTRDF